MNAEGFARRLCNLKRKHAPHIWYSRNHKRYFHCAGRVVQ